MCSDARLLVWLLCERDVHHCTFERLTSEAEGRHIIDHDFTI